MRKSWPGFARSIMSRRFFDTHLHLDADDDGEMLLKEARAAGVDHFLIAAADMAAAERARRLAEREPGVYATVGLHPHEAAEFDGVLEPYRRLAAAPEVVAIGEVGLDYHYENAPRAVQQRVLRVFLDLAAETELPCVIHCRDAFPDCLGILRECLRPGQKFEIHSFTGDAAAADAVLDLGGFLALNGIVTFPKARELQEVARRIPASRLLVETDSPYLAPAPFRGRRNQPAYLVEVLRAVAALRGTSLAEIGALTAVNGELFFGLNGGQIERAPDEMPAAV